MTAEEIEDGGLEGDMSDGEEGKEVVAERVADGKLGKVGREDAFNVALVASDGKLCEESQGIADRALRAEVVPAE